MLAVQRQVLITNML